MKKILIHTGIFVFMLGFLSSCASYKYSNKRKNEEVIMLVNEDINGIINSDNVLKQSSPSLGPSRGLATEAISLAAEGIKMLIEMDKKKYTANYAVSKKQLYFYNYISENDAVDATGIQFEGVEIIRTAKTAKNKIDTALYIKLVVDTDSPQEMINNSIFRMKVDSIDLDYAKAKVPGFRWYMPWTFIYTKKSQVNLDLELVFTASWMYRDGTMVRGNTIGNFMLNLRDIPLNKESEEYKDYFSNLKGKQLSGYSFFVPRSFGKYLNEQGEFLECYGQGTYNISASFNEAGKQHFITKIIQDNSNVMIEGVNTELLKLIP